MTDSVIVTRITPQRAARIASLIRGGDFLKMPESAQTSLIESIRSRRLKPVRPEKVKLPKEPKPPKAPKPPKIAKEKKPRKPRAKKANVEAVAETETAEFKGETIEQVQEQGQEQAPGQE